MAADWKGRMERMGRANEEARIQFLQGLTVERAIEVFEGLVAHPFAPPRPKSAPPVSLSRRIRRAHP